MLSIYVQISEMNRHYPLLICKQLGTRRCIWQGPIKPYRRSYIIKISYTEPEPAENKTLLEVQPMVQVTHPRLERHDDYDEGPIPHIYSNKIDPGLPFLCLFDPHINEWSAKDMIARTTVPWTERWLINYEFWLATGRWSGGGRHDSYENGPHDVTNNDAEAFNTMNTESA